MSGDPQRWADLRARALSAIVMVAVGGGAIVAGGLPLVLLGIVAPGLMMWELARMTRGAGADVSVLLGVLAAAVLVLNYWAMWHFWSPGLSLAPLALLLPSLVGALTPRRDRAVFAVYALVIVLTGIGLVALRNGVGLPAALCVLLVVVVSDVAGYFAGRLIGGPKFWPAISPKKTWSGTVAGWIGAALVGAGFMAAGWGGAQLLWILPIVAFAGQMGDIAESAIKRRAGVKDSSNLIPGHGGLLDRFDALAFAVPAALLIDLALPFMPAAGG